MCGIAGVVPLNGGAAADGVQLAAMCSTIVHRGPDSEGCDIRDGIALGMRRLSVIDVSGGRQPMFNEDRTVRLVFNGEIYNFRELRAELVAAGHRFATASDTEVLVHLWEEHGSGFAARLNGMFAIALHDSRRRRFVLVRDHFGIKPLYYALTRQHLVFGSEVKAVLASGLTGRSLDLDALGQFLAWEYVPAPATLLQEVRKLGPAEMLEVDLTTSQIARHTWWRLPAPGNPRNGDLPRTPGEWEEAIDAKVHESVQRQLVSDVPLGAFLSGGVDSSLVVAAMGPAHTYSIGFDDPSYNEVAWSKRVAESLGVTHSVEVIRPDVVGLFEHLMPFLDDPIGDFSIFPTYLVSRLARREVTVVLSGDGGDEIFGGYDTYAAQEKARAWRRIPGFVRQGMMEPLIGALRPRPAKKGLVNKARRFVEGLQNDERLGHARWRLFAGSALRRELFAPEAHAALSTPVEAHILELAGEVAGRSEVDRELYIDLKSYLSDNCLVKIDRMAMACSLEGRVPLLDPELVELAFRMPAELKVGREGTKILLKRVAARHVPKECVYRPKEGFSIPIKNWLGGELRPLVDDLLSSERLRREGVFRVETIERLRREHDAGVANHSHVLWSLTVFEDWRARWGV
ncbi:MAG TPA: asparagine synthase (glutamine-hydrolyzing) [Gemmatimonadales bacterium]|jgi:asparagine synthase (glutamine-hydrolysing)|nr:asparagine synthase (glutamine-hydrolyzing) [Gemmatimonadales bacterium]